MRTIDVRTDDELVAAAAGGNAAGFEELYRRHSEAAWGVAMSVTRNRNDAADAVSDAFTRLFAAVGSGRLTGVPFRPYLLTATRNASIDILRRTSRVDPTDTIDDGRLPRTAQVATPSDAVLLGAESALVAQAFADLPERWRSVLWLTEVEGMAPREAAEVLGLSANGAAQLAVRARAGLRERYLQAHVGSAASQPCRFTIDRLGAYVGGGLSARDIAKVDQHLAGCDNCRARKDELEDVGSTLRRAIVPIPLFLGAAVLGRLELASTSASASAGTTGSIGAASGATAWNGTTRALAGACAAVLALGIAGIGIRGDSDDVRTRIRQELASPPVVDGFSLSRPPAPAAFVPPPDAGVAAPGPGDVARSAPADTFDDLGTPQTPAVADAGTSTPPQPTTGTTAATEPAASSAPASEAPASAPEPDQPEPTPIAQVDATLGDASGIAAGIGDGSCTGVAVSGTGTECAAPEPDSTEQVGATVEVQGAPPVHIGL